MAHASPPQTGLRERKRQETLRRITDVGVRLFIENGFENTTIDEIAAAADISRRTFFYYFKSKDDVLLSMQGGMGDMIADALRAHPGGTSPMEALRNAILQASVPFDTENLIAIDRAMRSSEAVRLRKQASYIQHEQTVFAALRERWPAPERETALRLLAMTAIGAIRLSLEQFSAEDGKRPLIALLSEAFGALQVEI